jgi:hypothetical protein
MSSGTAGPGSFVAGRPAGQRQTTPFGTGTLARAAALVYTVLVVEALLLACCAPGLVALTLLDRDASNVPLAAACAVPVGPALSAALYALRRTGPAHLDLTDLHPAAAFLRGLRLNTGGVLRIWLPWLAGMTVLAVTLAHRAAAGVPGWWAALLVVLAVAATLWVANALVITSLFSFRTVDVARLAGWFLARTPTVTLANLCLLVVAGGVLLVGTEAGLALLGAALAGLLLRNCRPLVRLVEEEFTA